MSSAGTTPSRSLRLPTTSTGGPSSVPVPVLPVLHSPTWFPTAQTFSFSVGNVRRGGDDDGGPAVVPPAARRIFDFEQPIDDAAREADDSTTSAFAHALASTRIAVQETGLRGRARSHALRLTDPAHVHSRSVDSTPMPSPLLSRGSSESAASSSSSSLSNTTTGRLPPRIPSVPHLIRMHDRQDSAHSASITPSSATPSSAAANLPPQSVPSLSDLISPAESQHVTFHQWDSPTPVNATKARQVSPASMPNTPMTSTFNHAFPVPAPAPADDPLATLTPAWRELIARQESIDHVRGDPAVHALVDTGVPDCARGELWKLLSGSREERRRYPKGYYARLLSLHRLQGSAYDDEIRRDLARTLPGIELFNPRMQPDGESTSAAGQQVQPPLNGQGGLAKLNRVLCAYATRNKTLGYCQGMNMLAGTLLTILEEESSFWILVVLVESRTGYYCKSMCGLEVDQLVFGSLVSYFLPKLADHLRQFDVAIPSFTVSWFVCLFVEAPLEDMDAIYTVWDHLLLKGDEFLFTMSLALLRSKEQEIMRKRDTGELLEFLLHSGFKRGSGTPSNGSNACPLDIPSLLSTDIPRLGSLAREISSLREYHRNVVLSKSKVLHSHAAARLAETYKFSNGDEVQRLWSAFLAPSPWSILLHGSLTSLVKFYDSFCTLVFPEAVRRKWRDFGLFSGIGERLFKTIDSERRGEVSFESHSSRVSALKRSDVDLHSDSMISTAMVGSAARRCMPCSRCFTSCTTVARSVRVPSTRRMERHRQVFQHHPRIPLTTARMSRPSSFK
jgi:hypothetical protein